MPDALTPLQAFYVEAINTALFVGGFTALVAVFSLGFLVVRGMSSHG